MPSVYKAMLGALGLLLWACAGTSTAQLAAGAKAVPGCGQVQCQQGKCSETATTHQIYGIFDSSFRGLQAVDGGDWLLFGAVGSSDCAGPPVPSVLRTDLHGTTRWYHEDCQNAGQFIQDIRQSSSRVVLAVASSPWPTPGHKAYVQALAGSSGKTTWRQELSLSGDVTELLAGIGLFADRIVVLSSLPGTPDNAGRHWSLDLDGHPLGPPQPLAITPQMVAQTAICPAVVVGPQPSASGLAVGCVTADPSQFAWLQSFPTLGPPLALTAVNDQTLWLVTGSSAQGALTLTHLDNHGQALEQRLLINNPSVFQAISAQGPSVWLAWDAPARLARLRADGSLEENHLLAADLHNPRGLLATTDGSFWLTAEISLTTTWLGTHPQAVLLHLTSAGQEVCPP